MDDKLDAYTNPVAVSLIINAGTEYNISGKTSLVASLFFNNSFVDILSKNEISGHVEFVRLGGFGKSNVLVFGSQDLKMLNKSQ